MPLQILIVDDHAVVRRGVRSLLESQPDWEIAGEATTGREAVELAKQLQPDIVVMDLSLPELSGLDATRHILKESPRSEIVVLTMHHSEELARGTTRHQREDDRGSPRDHHAETTSSVGERPGALRDPQ